MEPTTSKLIAVQLLTGQGLGQGVWESPPKASATTGRDELSGEGRRGMWDYTHERETRLPPLLPQLLQKTAAAVLAMPPQAEVFAAPGKPSPAASALETRRRRARRSAWGWTASDAVRNKRRWTLRCLDPVKGGGGGPWRELNEWRHPSCARMDAVVVGSSAAETALTAGLRMR